MRVTFDTNVLDLACRPDRFPKDTRQPGLRKVVDALSSGAIEGFYSVTMLTIEGIMNNDRADVFSSTAADLAERDAVGVFPVGGWWKEKPFLERFDNLTRYSLIVSIKAPGSDVDIYTAVAAQVDVVTEIET